MPLPEHEAPVVLLPYTAMRGAPPVPAPALRPPSVMQALKELGIKSMGHRLKIINAMLIL